MTVACEIGKHKLCDGHGVDEDDNVVPCDCLCHQEKPLALGYMFGLNQKEKP